MYEQGLLNYLFEMYPRPLHFLLRSTEYGVSSHLLLVAPGLTSVVIHFRTCFAVVNQKRKHSELAHSYEHM